MGENLPRYPNIRRIGNAVVSLASAEARAAAWGLRYIREVSVPNVSSFAGRERLYGNAVTLERAQEALDAYRRHRDLSLGRTSSPKAILERGLGRRPLRESRTTFGGEVIFRCSSLGEAVKRTEELIGPISGQVKFFMAKLGIFRELAAKGEYYYSGMSVAAPRRTMRGVEQFYRSYRLDYDPKKGPHFNVVVCPSGSPKDNDQPESLNLVLVFSNPGCSIVRLMREIGEGIAVGEILPKNFLATLGG